MIQAVVSDFGGVLTSPLLLAFERVQDRIDIAPEAYGEAMAHSLAHDGVHPLFALERGEIAYEDFMGRRLGLPASGCAFVDDLEVNVDAARGAGMQGIVHRDNARTIAELASLLGRGQFSQPSRSQQ